MSAVVCFFGKNLLRPSLVRGFSGAVEMVMGVAGQPLGMFVSVFVVVASVVVRVSGMGVGGGSGLESAVGRFGG